MKHPGVRFPPPFLFAGGLAASALLRLWWPLPIRTAGPTTIVLLIAALLMTTGLAWMVWGLFTFHRARTGIVPHHPASQLVTHGPYRFGRNPMYLGLSAVYWAVTLWLNTLWAVILFPLVIYLLRRFMIAREERYLEHAFGVDYRRYCERVPRWLNVRG